VTDDLRCEAPTAKGSPCQRRVPTLHDRCGQHADLAVGAGERFRTDVVSTWELTVAELQVLDAAVATLDTIEDLTALVAADGRMVIGSKGQPVLHPGVPELRMQRAVLTRLIASLALPDPEGGTIKTPAQLAATAAVQTRWTAERRREQMGVVR
jgi:hypothetical protein